MITVKGTRSDDATSSPGDFYAEAEPPRRSRAPYLFTALLSAVALYFRSAQAGSAAQADTSTDTAQPGGSPKRPLADIGDEAMDDDQNRSESVERTAPLRMRASTGEDEPMLLGRSSFTVLRTDPSLGLATPEAANTNRLPYRLPAESDVLEGVLVEDPAADIPDEVSVPAPVSPPVAPPPRRNSPPAATRSPYMLDVGSGTVAVIALSDLLAPMADSDGDALSIIDASVSSGTLVPTETGFLYRSAEDFVGEVEFSYQITDGYSILTQIARLTVAAAVTEGTADADQISGTAFIEDLHGKAGNDEIAAAGGADIIHGGLGDDRISGGDGDDRIFGDDGDDLIFGEAGDDWISGGAGQDNIFGGAGDDAIMGDGGADVLSDGVGSDTVDGGEGDDAVIAAADGDDDQFDGGAGVDTLDYSSASAAIVIDLLEGVAEGDAIGEDQVRSFEIVISGSGDDYITTGNDAATVDGAAGNDWISGGAGQDKLAGGLGNDTLMGEEGADILSDGAGADVVDGGAGNDFVIAAADGQYDFLDGGEGTDTLDYSDTTSEIFFDLVEGVVEGTGIGEDEILGFEIIIAGSGDDHILAGVDSLIITGGEGNDRFEFVDVETSEALVRTIHEILDFEVGDCIVAQGIELFESSDGAVENLIELLEYDRSAGGQIPQIRLTYEKFETYDQTLIQWENDGSSDLTTVILQGHHTLAFALPA